MDTAQNEMFTLTEIPAAMNTQNEYLTFLLCVDGSSELVRLMRSGATQHLLELYECTRTRARIWFLSSL